MTRAILPLSVVMCVSLWGSIMNFLVNCITQVLFVMLFAINVFAIDFDSIDVGMKEAIVKKNGGKLISSGDGISTYHIKMKFYGHPEEGIISITNDKITSVYMILPISADNLTNFLNYAEKKEFRLAVLTDMQSKSFYFDQYSYKKVDEMIQIASEISLMYFKKNVSAAAKDKNDFEALLKSTDELKIIVGHVSFKKNVIEVVKSTNKAIISKMSK